MIDKKSLIFLAIALIVIVWIDCAYQFYNNHLQREETTSKENYRIQLYNKACSIDEEACERCADMAMKDNAYALSNSIRCLKAVVK